MIKLSMIELRMIELPMVKQGRCRTAWSIAFVASLLAACGSEQKPAEPPPVADTAFRDMAGAMDKARAVEGTMQQHKEGLDRALQQNENPSAAE